MRTSLRTACGLLVAFIAAIPLPALALDNAKPQFLAVVRAQMESINSGNGLSSAYFTVGDPNKVVKGVDSYMYGVVVDPAWMANYKSTEGKGNADGLTIPRDETDPYKKTRAGWIVLKNMNPTTCFHEAVHAYHLSIGSDDDVDPKGGPEALTNAYTSHVNRLRVLDDDIARVLREIEVGRPYQEELLRIKASIGLTKRFMDEQFSDNPGLAPVLANVSGKADWDGYLAELDRRIAEAQQKRAARANSVGIELKLTLPKSVRIGGVVRGALEVGSKAATSQGVHIRVSLIPSYRMGEKQLQFGGGAASRQTIQLENLDLRAPDTPGLLTVLASAQDEADPNKVIETSATMRIVEDESVTLLVTVEDASTHSRLANARVGILLDGKEIRDGISTKSGPLAFENLPTRLDKRNLSYEAVASLQGYETGRASTAADLTAETRVNLVVPLRPKADAAGLTEVALEVAGIKENVKIKWGADGKYWVAEITRQGIPYKDPKASKFSMTPPTKISQAIDAKVSLDAPLPKPWNLFLGVVPGDTKIGQLCGPSSNGCSLKRGPNPRGPGWAAGEDVEVWLCQGPTLCKGVDPVALIGINWVLP
jgi:hypothetical protein